MLRRTAALLAAFGLLLALAGPALAVDLKDAHVGVSWDDASLQGTLEECDEYDLQPGQVLWHFVQSPTDANAGTLTADFDGAGVVVIGQYQSPGSTLHWNVITGSPETLNDASTDAAGGELRVSHICSVPDEEIPEAPFALLLPIIALAAFGGYLFLNRRRVLDAA